MSQQKTTTTNALINASSPYLLQHAHNPVAWQEWGDAALNQAKKEDKPILVSIGYSSCHWCHVMERESFEQDDVAAIMNDFFVCIKVDREERPDIDQVYIEAVQAMGGNGGWPLNVFLTPDQKPFYGGTYYPAANWVNLLEQIHAAFIDKRQNIEQNAEQLTQHLGISDLHRFSQNSSSEAFNKSDPEKMFGILHGRFDKTWGGMEKAPKFVMPSIWLFLLRYFEISKDPASLEMVRHTLMKMQQGGLYDQLGGGFSRYSVDGEWFAPHFEKMLYDNAQLVSLYSEAWAVTKEPTFKRVVFQTIGWLQREMMHPDGGFYSALDADSEGSEGKFYTWTYNELQEVLHEKTAGIARYFNATAAGNWEHGRNILKDTSAALPSDEIAESIQKLLLKRNERIHPGLDDKILAGWNAMMIKGLMDAWIYFQEPWFLRLAERAMQFLENNLMDGTRVHRSFKNKRSVTEGFLEDYAFVIQAYTSLYQGTFNEMYLQRAIKLNQYVIESFYDEADGYFHFTGNEARKLIARKKEIFDNVIPASNSVMAINLYHLGTILDNNEWKQLAEKMVQGLQEIIRSEPAYLSNWGILLEEAVHGLAEIVIAGRAAETKRAELSGNFLPFSVIMGASKKNDLPLFEGRSAEGDETKIYVCYNKTCRLPVHEVSDALSQLRQGIDR